MNAILLLMSALGATTTHATAPAVGEAHRWINLAAAATRRADKLPRMRVTIWYPAAGRPRQSEEVEGPPADPLLTIARVARDARPAVGRRPVILISHGFGGSAQDMGWLGAAFARSGYIALSVDHPGNSFGDMTDIGGTVWWERPRDMIAALRAIEADPEFGSRVDERRVAAAGFSLGATTALALAGAELDPANFDRYCKVFPADGVCLPPPEAPQARHVTQEQAIALLGLQASAARAHQGTQLPGVRAVLAIAPPSQMLDPATLPDIHVPVVLVVGDQDRMVPADHNAAPAARAIKGASLILVPGAGHYSFIPSCTAAGRAKLPICRSASVQERAHAMAIRAGLMLFRRVFGTPRYRIHAAGRSDHRLTLRANR